MLSLSIDDSALFTTMRAEYIAYIYHILARGYDRRVIDVGRTEAYRLFDIIPQVKVMLSYAQYLIATEYVLYASDKVRCIHFIGSFIAKVSVLMDFIPHLSHATDCGGMHEQSQGYTAPTIPSTS